MHSIEKIENELTYLNSPGFVLRNRSIYVEYCPQCNKLAIAAGNTGSCVCNHAKENVALDRNVNKNSGLSIVIGYYYDIESTDQFLRIDRYQLKYKLEGSKIIKELVKEAELSFNTVTNKLDCISTMEKDRENIALARFAKPIYKPILAEVDGKYVGLKKVIHVETKYIPKSNKMDIEEIIRFKCFKNTGIQEYCNFIKNEYNWEGSKLLLSTLLYWDKISAGYQILEKLVKTKYRNVVPFIVHDNEFKCGNLQKGNISIKEYFNIKGDQLDKAYKLGFKNVNGNERFYSERFYTACIYLRMYSYNESAVKYALDNCDWEWLRYNVNNMERLREFGYTSLEKLVKYKVAYEAMYNSHRDILNQLLDYTQMCKNSNARCIYYPRDLERLHDNIMTTITLKKSKIMNNDFNSRVNDIKKKYEYHNAEYCIVIPESINSIIKEGKEMHHCVGSYASRMAQGLTDILFMRRCSEPQKSYVTIEVSSNTVVQAQTAYNKGINDDIYNFIVEWCSNKGIKLRLYRRGA